MPGTRAISHLSCRSSRRLTWESGRAGVGAGGLWKFFAFVDAFEDPGAQ